MDEARKKRQRMLYALMGKSSYYTIREKKVAKEMMRTGEISAFTYSLNPIFLEKLYEDTHMFITFVDSRRADCYFELKSYLEKNKNKYTAFCTAGDADFVILSLADNKSHERFYDTLLDIHKLAPFDEKVEELLHSYKISKYYILSGKSIASFEDINEEDINRDVDFLSKIDLTQKNYMNPILVKRFRSENAVKDFLEELERRKILINYYIIRNFISYKIRAYVLVLYTQIGFENHILRIKDITLPIIDFFSVTPSHIYDKFYNKVDFVIVAEFDSIEQYHQWKERLYVICNEKSQNINVMTYVVEGIISEIPYGVGNYSAFQDLCTEYQLRQPDNGISLGRPIYYGAEEKNVEIYMDLRTLNEHGLILGEPKQGKTTTVMAIAKNISKTGKRVHIVDSTGGLDTKIVEFLPSNFPKEIVDIKGVLERGYITFSNLANGIYFYNPNEKNLIKIVRLILEAIPSKDTKQRLTSDIIIFEESHKIFSNKILIDAIFSKIRTAGRQGVSIWFSTQKLSDLPTKKTSKGECDLQSDLHNRIVHKTQEIDVDDVAKFLFEPLGNGIEVYDLTREIVNLRPGEAFVSLPSVKNGVRQLPPIKIKIISKKV
jgi:hypothetical protein